MWRRNSLCLFVLIAGISLLFTTQHTSAAAPSAKVVLDGTELAFSIGPIVANGNVLVPYREIFTTFGMEVEWDNQKKIATASKEGLVITMSESFTATINGKPYTLTQTPYWNPVDEMFFVNLRFISESTGATVSWDNTSKTVYISSK